MRPSHGTINSGQKIDGLAHFVRGRQPDGRRPHRKTLVAILRLSDSAQTLGSSVSIYRE